MRMTAFANGVRGLHSRRQTRGPQVRTLRLLPTSEITLRKFGELSKDPGSASRLSEPQFGELKNGGRRPSWVIVFAYGARGDFGGEPRGSTPKSVFPMLARPFGCTSGSSSQTPQPPTPSLSSSSLYHILRIWPRLPLLLPFLPPSLPMRRSSSPPLSTSYATAQFTRVLFRLCA